MNILMRVGLCLIACASACSPGGKPPKRIPYQLKKAYTWNREIPVHYGKYYDDTVPSDAPSIYTVDTVERFVRQAKGKETKYYGKTDLFLYEAIETVPGDFQGKTVGVIGSVTPWYESIVLAYGGKPTSIDYNKIISEDTRVSTLTVAEYGEHPLQFDYLFSISSFEHDGLGRYGDPLNPEGDRAAMEKAKSMLKPGGLLFLSVPVGKDYIYWNAHRIYGEKRLPYLLEGWEVVKTCGLKEGDLQVRRLSNILQPVFVLRLKAD